MEDNLDLRIGSIAEKLVSIEETVREIRSLVGPFGVSFGNDTILVQTIHGIKYIIDSTDLVMAPQLVVYRQWEAELTKFISNSLTPDTVFVDVGASFGYYTCLAATKIGQSGTGKVFSFEPNKKIHNLLKKNLFINWSMAPVMVFESALSDSTGYADFFVPHGYSANARFSGTEHQGEGEQKFSVRTMTLDEAIGETNVDLMKIDVEGFETAVLRGAPKVIARSESLIIIIEWSLGQMQTAGYSANDLFDLFDKYGLAAYKLPETRFLDEDTWRTLSISRNELQGFAYDNIVLRRPIN